MNNIPQHSHLPIIIGSDHAAFPLKEKIRKYLIEKGFEVLDVGAHSLESVDYPDFGIQVAEYVSKGKTDRGILLCGTGIGMSMVANKFPHVRAALCNDLFSAIMSRRHNDANILAIGGRMVGETLGLEIVNAWLTTPFDGERHTQRINKYNISSKLTQQWNASYIKKIDPEIAAAISQETDRQHHTLELIASENIASPAVMAVQGSVLTNKYAEGYPQKRYYGGCDYVDIAESLAIKRAQKLFYAAYVNVQPHSGSQANMAVYFSLLKPGDTVLGMDLSHGGHLTHGSPVNFSGRLFHFIHYGVDRKTGMIDYAELAHLAEKHQPKLIVAGASAYPRFIDFEAFDRISKSVGAYLMVDMAHIAGLVAAGIHPSPIPFADVVTSTTHKTLRGPRGGLILGKTEFGERLNKQIFPGIQGGPLMHVIAAKAVAFQEALSESFKIYQVNTVKNAQALANHMIQQGFELVSNGTDNHMLLVDLRNFNMTGKEAEDLLGRAGITVNKNAVPFDTQSPLITSGIRIGSPAVSTRGMKEPEMETIAAMIADVLKNGVKDIGVLPRVRRQVKELCAAFPAYL